MSSPAPALTRTGATPPADLLWLTGGLLAGQLIAPVAPGPLPLAAALVAAALCGLRRHWVVAAALLLAGLGHWQVDALRRPAADPTDVSAFAGGAAEVRGWVADRPARQPRQTRLTLEVTAMRRGARWQRAHGRVLVTVRDATQPWRRGDRARALLRLRRPRNFGNPGEFDYEGYLARRGIRTTAFAPSDAGWHRRAAPRASLAARLEARRDAAAAAIAATLDGPARAIVAALLIGDMAGLSAELQERYSRAGVSHILSISGLHISLVAGSAYTAARWLLARSEWLLLCANVPKIAQALAVWPVLLYAGIAGGNLPTLRAVAMGLLLLGGTLLDRARDWLTGLAAAALAINLCWPGSVFEISFQLSFIAVLAIVLGMRRVTAWWDDWEERHLIRLRSPRWRAVRWLVLYEAVTVCAVLGTAPLAAWHFNRVSLIALFANALVVPLLGIVPVSAGLLAILTLPWSPHCAAALFAIAGAFAALADRLVAFCAALPGAALNVVTPSLLELTLLYGLLAALLIPRPAARRAAAALCALLLCADVSYWYARRNGHPDLEITFLSVGQGDSAIVEFPGSAVMVVDGGGLSGTFDVGARVIAPQLWRRKIRQVDVLVLTHPDYDHYGGLTFLAGAFAPAALWWNGASGSGRRFEELWETLVARDIPTVAIGHGFRRDIGGVEVTALAPDGLPRGKSNDGSLALRLRYGPTAVLFAGDLEAAGERGLVVSAGAAVASTVLKVPHHGSRTSSTATLLDAVAPRLAVISAGYENHFGMPHREVLDAYRRRGIAIWRTDRDGAVTMRIAADGAIRIDSLRPRDRLAEAERGSAD